MINITGKTRHDYKTNTHVLKEVLEDQLEKVRNDLESLPLDKIARLQGYSAALRDVINLLPK